MVPRLGPRTCSESPKEWCAPMPGSCPRPAFGRRLFVQPARCIYPATSRPPLFSPVMVQMAGKRERTAEQIRANGNDCSTRLWSCTFAHPPTMGHLNQLSAVACEEQLGTIARHTGTDPRAITCEPPAAIAVGDNSSTPGCVGQGNGAQVSVVGSGLSSARI